MRKITLTSCINQNTRRLLQKIQFEEKIDAGLQSAMLTIGNPKGAFKFQRMLCRRRIDRARSMRPMRDGQKGTRYSHAYGQNSIYPELAALSSSREPSILNYRKQPQLL